jgi:nucleoside-diphosphate-sugar epimerase
MKIFVAGGSGAVGARLVPLLVRAGHSVTATTRRAEKAAALRAAGAAPVVLDALDETAVRTAVLAAQPEVVVHQLTAIPARLDLRRFERDFAATNRLRREGTDHLLAAARAAGVRRFIAQSFAGWPYAREGGPVKTEEDRIDPHPPPALRDALAAIRHLESAVLGTAEVTGIVLRYGGFYGPGTSIGPDGTLSRDVRRRRVPVIGSGAGVWSFVHIDDAAAATLAAVEHGQAGVYNIVDDDPAPVAEWLPTLATALGARPPWHLPVWLARLIVGEHGVALMTEIRGASNAKAKRALGWQPAHASWRQGFLTLRA